MDRIQPIRRDATPGTVPGVAPVARGEREPQREQRERRRKSPTPEPVITRDDDGTPHVDIRA
jgi:hypothetical protein